MLSQGVHWLNYSPIKISPFVKKGASPFSTCVSKLYSSCEAKACIDSTIHQSKFLPLKRKGQALSLPVFQFYI
mgnify:CR=1 FL=1